MNQIFNKLILTLVIFTCNNLIAQDEMKFDIPYGNNDTIGKLIEINDAKIYFEAYGEGEPLLLIHGNSGSVKDMANQIDYFKKKYRVIIADNRGHGKSELRTDSLTYRQIAEDWEGLVKYLELDSVSIMGWSDGGIVALLMGINQKSKIRKIVTMGANLRPDSTAVYSWAVDYLKEVRPVVDIKIQERDTTNDWGLLKQRLGLLGDQPNIKLSELASFSTPTLIIAGDQDIIREEHSVQMFQNIQNAQLCIVPGETHYMPTTSPDLFNGIVYRFLSEEFKRPDSNFTKKKN